MLIEMFFWSLKNWWWCAFWKISIVKLIKVGKLLWHVRFFIILYINSVSLSVRQCVSVGPKTHITFNKTVPPNSKAQKLLRTSSFYFLLLRSFLHSNYRRRWGRYFWDLEGGWGDLGALFLGSGFRRVMIFIFFVEGGRGWGWGSRGLNRWKWTGVGNAKDRVGGSTRCIMHPGSH
jgi:hypothetical protein